MEVSTITVYKTKDGKKFTDKTRAEEHEFKLNSKTIHYIINFARLTINKVFYLRVKETNYGGQDTSFRSYTYETESGVSITDDTIHGQPHIIILTEKEYALENVIISNMFTERTKYENYYATTKFTNPTIKESKNGRRKNSSN